MSSALRAKVQGGRLVVDEPTSFAEGTVLELMVADNDDLDDAERAHLDEALEASLASAREATIDADELLAEIARLEPTRG
ncbi:hypothetical protein BE04_40795 [Sorangium cellulosum]|uniref:Uncharacterized protein n=2 Tax=Sorangium cellulosum TaxID=56 RepID=A0A150QP29_SORCE|nr:hypothetical protein [Sorangium cellulosum]AGP34414.1 hypothetical protein SCE1572_07775 [Sorangium cellulosum So0157-2]KYF69408.1 hypothetical protein BE04_40795 [Sorangium cellulosum]KYG06966.1 hypothetical protein BE21_31810 [Sorangium cellulosum]